MFENRNNSHAYIFYTNNFELCKNDVYNLVRKIFSVDNINLISSDFIVVPKSDKKSIIKDDMIDLRNFFQKTSYLNSYRMYLIEEIHKLNSTSANMILKFLEEPFNGIVALFITTNLDNVLPTIKSRCQVINCFYEQTSDVKVQNFELIEKIFSDSKYENIFMLKKLFEKYDRNDLIVLFNDYLNSLYNNFTLEIKKRILIVNKAINLLNNNVNIDYVLDYMCLEGGVL